MLDRYRSIPSWYEAPVGVLALEATSARVGPEATTRGEAAMRAPSSGSAIGDLRVADATALVAHAIVCIGTRRRVRSITVAMASGTAVSSPVSPRAYDAWPMCLKRRAPK